MEKDKQYSQFLKISKEIGLPVKKVLDVLFVLKNGNKVENNELIRRTGISKNVINQVKDMLGTILLPTSNHTQANTGSLNLINNVLGENYIPEENLLNLKYDYDLEELLKRRVSPLRKLDQFTATKETVYKRAGLLNFLGDITGKKILLLGDNDFSSIAFVTLGTANEISVLDIDQRITESLRKISQERNFGIKTIEHDLRNSLPKDMSNNFDVIFTDPPYTTEGITLFISRAISALNKQNKAARIYFCYGNSDRAKERYIPIHKSITDSGLMVRWIFDRFNRYKGAESIGSSSSLFVCEVTPKTKPLIKGKFTGNIYTS